MTNELIVLAQAPSHCYELSEQRELVQWVLQLLAALTVDGQLSVLLDKCHLVQQ